MTIEYILVRTSLLCIILRRNKQRIPTFNPKCWSSQKAKFMIVDCREANNVILKDKSTREWRADLIAISDMALQKEKERARKKKKAYTSAISFKHGK